MWVVIVLVSLATIATIFLCIPLELTLRASTEDKSKFSLKIIWFFGLIIKDLSQSKKKPVKNAVAKIEDKSANNWLQQLKMALEILQTKGLLKQLRNFVVRTFKIARIRELAANLKVDLENPADTGLLFAVIAPLNLLVNHFVSYPIKIEPSFTGESLVSGYLNCSIRLLPIQMAVSVALLAFSLPALRVAKKLVSNRWKRKK